jgi:hypothetical protein
MSKRKVITARVAVFRVKGETIEIAFNNFKHEHSLDDYHLTIIDKLSKESIAAGGIYLKGRELYPQYVGNKISEHTIFGCLYNHKPVLKDESRIIKHNVINRGTKKWITVNNYVTDSGEVLEHDTETKEAVKVRAVELSLEHSKTVNAVLGKKLEDGEGILFISEYIPSDCVDDSNVYIFWMLITEVNEVEEDDLIAETTEVDEVGQLSIKDDIHTYVGRSIITPSDGED